MIHRQSWHDALASTFLRFPRDLSRSFVAPRTQKRGVAQVAIRRPLRESQHSQGEFGHLFSVKPFTTGDEALARVAGDARSDIRMLFNAKGALLNPHEWPDEIAHSVEAVDLTSGKVKLASKSNARRTILEVCWGGQDRIRGLRSTSGIL